VVDIFLFFCVLVLSCDIQMAALAEDKSLQEVRVEKIHALNLEGELRGELNLWRGSRSETLCCRGENISPIKCAGCDKAIMLSTFYDSAVPDSSGNMMRGRVILCGSDNPLKIRREELEHVPPPNEEYDRYLCNRKYYCSDTCPSGCLTGCLEKTALEVDCEYPFMRVVFSVGSPELLQDRVQQLDCPEGCNGQCLLDACVRYADDTYNSKKYCPDCKTPIWIQLAEPFEEFMKMTEKGILGNGSDVFICGHIKSTRKQCARCYEHLGLFEHIVDIVEPKGCIGLKCDGECLDQHVKNYIVPRSLKRNKN
jgi:hypothetical protein